MNQMETINICAGANERFMTGATAAFAGVALNARRETHLHFHIFTEGVKPETVEFMRRTLKRLHERSEVVEHVCDDKLLEGLPYWAGSRLSAARVFYPYLMKDVDWALYVDCDVLYFVSPEEHWSFRDEDVYACVTQDDGCKARVRECEWAKRCCGVDLPEREYFNAGIMLFNLRKCREDKIPDRIQQFYKDHPDVTLPDQTAMNVLFHGHKCMLPSRFNKLQFALTDEDLAERCNVHYVLGNPWMPKCGVTATNRFHLWHQFCDKYVWQCKGASYAHSFPKRVLWAKKLLYVLLRIPVAGMITARLLQMAGFTANGLAWRRTQVGHDITASAIDKVLNASCSA